MAHVNRGQPPPPPPPAEPVFENPISLKVMRLSKPKFNLGIGVPFNLPPIATLDGSGAASPSPQPAFGDIYLGETFSAFVSLANKAAVELQHVVLRVEVRTDNNREPIREERAIDRLPVRGTLDKIVKYELKDTGMHILSCLALYTDPQGERKQFKKFYKFQVLNPLKMKEKTHELAAHQDIIVETQVQNATPRLLFLESVRFLPSPQFDVLPFPQSSDHAALPSKTSDAIDVSDAGDRGAAAAPGAPDAPTSAPLLDGEVTTAVGLPSLGHMAYLKEGDVQQFMFRLRGKLPAAQLKRTTALGRMEVVWKSSMGEKGRLQSNPVQRKPQPAKAIEVNVVEAPSEVAMESPFTVRAVVANTSSKEQMLQLHFETQPGRTGGFVLDGVSGSNVGLLRPHGTLEFSFRVMALDTGIHKLNGLYFYDVSSQQRLDAGPLVDIFVLPAAEVNSDSGPVSGSAPTKGACYLVYSETNSGCLLLHWSDKAVEGALAAFVPKTPAPRFKFTTNNGRSELIRDCGGVKVRRFYDGVGMFLKTAKSFDARFTHIRNLDVLPFAIYLNDENQRVVKVPLGGISHGAGFESVRAIAIMPLLDPSLSVRTMNTRQFQQVAEKVGSSLSFDGGGTGRHSATFTGKVPLRDT